MRKFTSGASRDTDVGKLDYEGFESPLVIKRYAQYMHKHRLQADGNLRGSDNWQLGMSKEAYMKSLVRHMMDLRLHWDGFPDEAEDKDLESVLCAVLFNVKGLLYENLVEKKGLRNEEAPIGVCFDAQSVLERYGSGGSDTLASILSGPK